MSPAPSGPAGDAPQLDRARGLAAQAAALLDAGQVPEAVEACRQAVAIAPGDAAAHANLASALLRLGDFPSTLHVCDRALALDAQCVAARQTRGVALLRLGRAQEALVDTLALTQSHPRVAGFHFNLAETQLALGQDAVALASARAALDLDPSHAGAQLDCALALSSLGRLDEAQHAFDRLHALDPDYLRAVVGAPRKPGTPPINLNPLHLYLERGFERLSRADWSDRDGYVRRFADFAAASEPLDPGLQPLAYHALSLPIEPALAANLARRLALAHVRRAGALPVPAAPRSGRVRVGYLSPDFREHTNGYLAYPLFRLADRQRIEAFACSLYPDDGSECSRRIRAAAEHFVDLSAMDDETAAARIRNDGIDVLVDLGGYTAGARPGILARLPAPAQVAYLGFPGSMHAEFIDYRVSDAVADPPGSEGAESEALVRLPHTFYLYDRDEPQAATPLSRADYGLPQDAVVFCALHQPYKIEPVMFDLWMRLLQKVPDSVLWLPGREPRAAENLAREAAARGVPAQRLRFAPHEPRPRYFARFALADLMLDARLFNAMTTACDALWMGLPVIACAGQTFAARVGQSLLVAAGLPDLVAPDMAAYERLALELARDRDRREAVEARVAAARSAALFDTPARVRELETAWLAIAQRARAGRPPAPIIVAPAPPRPAWY